GAAAPHARGAPVQPPVGRGRRGRTALVRRGPRGVRGAARHRPRLAHRGAGPRRRRLAVHPVAAPPAAGTGRPAPPPAAHPLSLSSVPRAWRTGLQSLSGRERPRRPIAGAHPVNAGPGGIDGAAARCGGHAALPVQPVDRRGRAAPRRAAPAHDRRQRCTRSAGRTGVAGHVLNTDTTATPAPTEPTEDSAVSRAADPAEARGAAVPPGPRRSRPHARAAPAPPATRGFRSGSRIVDGKAPAPGGGESERRSVPSARRRSPSTVQGPGDRPISRKANTWPRTV